MLTIKEERKQYFINYKLDNDKEALKNLVLTYLELIDKIAARHVNKGLEKDELISIGVEVVITTINAADYKKDFDALHIRIVQNIDRHMVSETNKGCIMNGYIDSINHHKNDLFETDFENIEKAIDIEKALSLLDDRQKMVLIARYGLKNNPQLPIETISEYYNVANRVITTDQCKAERILKHSNLLK